MKTSPLYTEADGERVAIAQQIVDEYNEDVGIRHRVHESCEPFRALMDQTSVVDNTDAFDGSDAYWNIVDVLDRWNVSGVLPKDQKGNEDSSRVLDQ